MNDYLDRVESQLTQLTEQGAAPAPAGSSPGPGPTPRRWPAPAAPRLRGAGGTGRGRGRRGGRGDRAGERAHAQAANDGGVERGALADGHGQDARPPEPRPRRRPPRRPRCPHTSPRSRSPRSAISTGGCSAPGLALPRRRRRAGRSCQTTNGGRAFTAIHAPPAPLVTESSGTSGYAQIRFADANNGFAYGPDLYATHDGGTSWRGGRCGWRGHRPRDHGRPGLRDGRADERRQRAADALAGGPRRLERRARRRRRLGRPVGAGHRRDRPVGPGDRDRRQRAGLARRRPELHRLPRALARAALRVRGTGAAGGLGAVRDRDGQRRVALERRRRTLHRGREHRAEPAELGGVRGGVGEHRGGRLPAALPDHRRRRDLEPDGPDAASPSGPTSASPTPRTGSRWGSSGRSRRPTSGSSTRPTAVRPTTASRCREARLVGRRAGDGRRQACSSSRSPPPRLRACGPRRAPDRSWPPPTPAGIGRCSRCPGRSRRSRSHGKRFGHSAARTVITCGAQRFSRTGDCPT